MSDIPNVDAQQYLKELQALAEAPGRDFESDHSEADDLLCHMLFQLGFEEHVKAWQKVGKWYA